MKKFILPLFFFLTLYSPCHLWGMPAYPKPVRVTQPDGSSITVRIYGDEFFSRITTTDGYTILQKEDGFYYYAVPESNGTLTASGIRVSDPVRRSPQERALTVSLSKELTSSRAMMEAEIRRVETNSRRAEKLEMRQIDNGGGSRVETRAVEHVSGIVLLVEFQDVAFTKAPDPQAAFHDLFNQEGYNVSGAAGSVRDYFLFNSNGKYDVSFDVKGPYKVSRNVAYYGQNSIMGDMRPGEMVREACQLAYADGVDFSRYAVNGEVPNLLIIYAGYGEADSGIANTIWQHEATLSGQGGPLVLGGIKLDTYACSQEIYARTEQLTGIGVVCHEFSHVLGIPDFYDTDGPTNGDALGLWVTSVMDAGGYLSNGHVPPAYNVVERFLSGWVELTDITQGGQYLLEPIYSGQAFRIKTYVSNEFFLFEYRDGTLSPWDRFLQEGDQGFNPNIIGHTSGMMVYHYDRSTNRIPSSFYMARDLWDRNKVNAYEAHECIRMLTTVTAKDPNKWNMSHLVFPGVHKRTELTPESIPALLSWAGTNTGFAIKNIKVNGGQNVTFTVINLNESLEGFVSADPSQFSVTVSIDESLEGKWYVACIEKNSNEIVFSRTFNSNVFNIGALHSKTPYEIRVTKAQNETNFVVLDVTTGEIDTNSIPSLNIASAYSSGQYVVLDVINLQDEVVSVKWYVDGREVSETLINPDDGVHEIKCVVTGADSATETLLKYITVG